MKQIFSSWIFFASLHGQDLRLKTDFSEWNKKVTTAEGHGKDKLYLLGKSRIDGEDCEVAYKLQNN